MAIIKKTDPIFGDLSGLLGPVVISKARGVKVLKTRPSIDTKLRAKKNKGKPKSGQKLKMGLVSAFISKIQSYTNIGFGKTKNDNAAFPSAVQYNIGKAVSGTKPDFVINYPEAVISIGHREMAWSSQLSWNDPDVLTITWEIPATVNIREVGNDLAYILLYDEILDQPIECEQYVTRSELSFSQKIDTAHVGNIIHAWIFFVAPDKKSRSRSDYIGSIIVAA